MCVYALCIMHYAFKDYNELCTMLTPNSEHVFNVDTEFTHNAKCAHN